MSDIVSINRSEQVRDAVLVSIMDVISVTVEGNRQESSCTLPTVLQAISCCVHTHANTQSNIEFYKYLFLSPLEITKNTKPKHHNKRLIMEIK